MQVRSLSAYSLDVVAELVEACAEDGAPDYVTNVLDRLSPEDRLSAVQGAISSGGDSECLMTAYLNSRPAPKKSPVPMMLLAGSAFAMFVMLR